MAKLSRQIDSGWKGGLGFIEIPITAAANTTAVEVTVPEDCTIVDVIVQARAASVGGTATLRTSTDAISDAIVMAVDTTIVRAGTLNATRSEQDRGDTINVITNGAADRGLVTVVYLPR